MNSMTDTELRELDVLIRRAAIARHERVAAESALRIASQRVADAEPDAAAADAELREFVMRIVNGVELVEAAAATPDHPSIRWHTPQPVGEPDPNNDSGAQG